LYQDHSPKTYRKYSYRDFIKFYPWAEANGLLPHSPPPHVNLVIIPDNAVYPSADALFPNVNYVSVLSLPYLQFTLTTQAHVSDSSAPWVCGYLLAGQSLPTLVPYPHNVKLLSFMIAGPTQQSVPVGNLSITDYCVLLPQIAVPDLFASKL
jgi:hypothetical protein